MSGERARPWQNPTPLIGYEPEWAGQFDTFYNWVDHASRALTGVRGSVGEALGAICIDAKGRRCNVGKDFQRARDEGAFPIRYFWTFRPTSAGQDERIRNLGEGPTGETVYEIEMDEDQKAEA